MQYNKTQKIQVWQYIGIVLFIVAFSSGGYAQDSKSTLANFYQGQKSSKDINKATAERLKTIVSLKKGSQNLVSALQSIARQTGLKLSYSEQVISPAQKVTIKKAKLPAEQALGDVLEGTGYRFGISASGQLVLVKMQRPAPPSQQETITGIVTDGQSGETLPGVNILVKGTSTGTSTNAQGAYELTVESLQDTLVFSFVGYQQQSAPINGRTEINIEMQSQTISGDEMVVVGYGTQRRSEVTESITTLSQEDLNQERATRVDQALQGKVAGVSIAQETGRPGSDMKVRIRGSNSIQGDNSPLYVVDGIITGGISNLDVNNIQSIEVLKDASATAIYGSRGSNGVVLVTTKRGSGEGKFELNSSYGIQKIANRLEIMNGPEFAKMVNAEREANGVNPAFTEETIANLEQRGGTDYQDEIFRTAPLQKHALTYSGGSDKVNYYLSGSFLDQTGIVIKQGYQRYNLRANVDFQFSDKLDLSLNFKASREERNKEDANITQGIVFDPTTPVKNSEGAYNLRSTLGSNALNQVPVANKSSLANIDHSISPNLNINYDILDNLTFQVKAGLEYLTFAHQSYTPIFLDNQGTANSNDFNRISLQNTNRLTFQEDFGIHGIKADLIFEQQFIQREGVGTTAWNFPSDATTFKNIAIASDQSVASSFNSEKLRSYVGRVNYSLNEKYLITSTFRVDGSSKFRKGNRYGVFPSASIGWRLSNESFIKKLNAFDELKLRASYGVTGSQAVAPYATRAVLSTGSGEGYPINDEGLVTGIDASNSLANPDLTWEETTQINLGLDMTLKNPDLTLTIDAYQAKTKDLLLAVQLPKYTGTNIVTRNLGEIQNRGIEFTLGTQPFRGNDFNLSADFNLSINRNEVIDVGLGRTRIYPDNIFQGSFTNQTEVAVVQVGEPLGVFQGYNWLGIYQEDEAQEAARFNKNPGDSKYEDLNDDGKIDGADIGILDTSEPDFIFGVNTSMSYKNFDFNALIQGSIGGHVYNLYKGMLYGWGAGITRNPLHKDILDRWTPENHSNSVAAFGPSRSGYVNSSQFLEEGSYAKLKNLTLGYTLPQRLVSDKLGFRQIRVYANAENLLTITNYSGFDPELTSGGASDTDARIDVGPYPSAKTITLGLNVSF